MQLDSHRASCAICLLDFEEPKRVDVVAPEPDAARTTAGAEVVEDAPEAQQEVEGDVTEQVDAPASPTGDALRLQDAGQGAQPLRLLKCGHVFHVSPSLPAQVFITDTPHHHCLSIYRKLVWIRGCSMYLAAVQYASDLSASRRM